MDFVTGLPPSGGNNTILTIVDRFSKVVHFVPLPKLATALETANLLITHVFRLDCIPQEIVSDRGPQFTSQVWRTYCKALGATSSLTSGYHPQSNRQTEHTNHLETSLRCVASRLPSSWATHLPWVEYAHNTLVSSATGMSPFMVNHGYQPPLIPSQEMDIAVPSVQAQFSCVHGGRPEQLWAGLWSAGGPPPDPSFPLQGWTAGMALNTRPPVQLESLKMSAKLIGPYTINKVVNPSAVHFTLPPSLNVHPVFHVSLLKPVTNSPLQPLAPPPPSPRLIEGHPANTVNRILDVRRCGRVTGSATMQANMNTYNRRLKKNHYIEVH